MNGLFYLGHLVYTKNEINRRRFRFYAAWKGRSAYVDGKYSHRFPTHLNQLEGELGYKKAQMDMKAMTPNMRQQRKDLNARFVWGDSGNILAIELDGKRYNSKEIYHLHEAYLADEILLGD